jgi:hypothetical protein
VTTDRNGRVNLRAFLGEYEVTASHGETTERAEYTLDRKGGVVKIVLDRRGTPGINR